VLTDPSAFAEVCDALESADIEAGSKDVTLLPTLTVPVADEALARSVLKFVAALEDNDDVQNVYTNMEMTDEVMDAVGADE
jgi:transcriptional/translational regulatory protein YebC/TACO1